MDYFEKEYSSDELADDWKDYLIADKSNFNKFVMDDDDFIFYFDEGTAEEEKRIYRSTCLEVSAGGFPAFFDNRTLYRSGQTYGGSYI